MQQSFKPTPINRYSLLQQIMAKSSKNSANAPSATPQESPMRLVLQVTDPETDAVKMIAARLQERLIAGRTGSSPDSNEGKPLPDIDLSSFNALDHGVSRQHAAFVYRDEELSVEDLNSTNGTRINGFQIMPGRIYRLRNGDELEFGRLRMTIKIVRAPH